MTGAEGLAVAFVGGVLTLASPCVLAAVPVAVGYVGGQALSPRRAWALALAFVAGMNVALLAGATPGAASALMCRFAPAQAWLPGRGSFAVLLAAAGLWWVAIGLVPEWAKVLAIA